MESEKQRNQRLYPEMFAIVESCRGCITSAAIIEDGEVTSGRLPGDDYKFAEIENWGRPPQPLPPPAKSPDREPAKTNRRVNSRRH